MGAVFQGNWKICLEAFAAEIGGRGGKPRGSLSLPECAIANLSLQCRAFQPLRPVRPQYDFIQGGAPAQMQPDRCSNAARVGVLSFRRPGTAGTRIMVIKNPLHDRFMQRPDLVRIFVRAIHTNH